MSEPQGVKVVARYRDTRDGYEGEDVWHATWIPDDWDATEEGMEDMLSGQHYYHTEGNFGCDCNRSIALYPNDESKQLDCNRERNIIELLSLRVGEHEVDLSDEYEPPYRETATLTLKIAPNSIRRIDDEPCK